MEKHKHGEHHKENKKRTKQDTKMLIIALVLGILILVSGIQTLELMSLKNNLNAEIGTLSSGSSQKTISTGSSSGTLSDNLNNLPQMVGGC